MNWEHEINGIPREDPSPEPVEKLRAFYAEQATKAQDEATVACINRILDTMKHTIEVTTRDLTRLINGIAFAESEHNGYEADQYDKLLRKLCKYQDRITAKPGPAKPYVLKHEPSIQEAYELAIAEHVCKTGSVKGKSSAPLRGVEGPATLDDYTPPYDINVPGPGEDKEPHIGYICFACSSRLKAVWPEGHVATCHMGICPECNTRQSLASVDDWNWPKGSKRPKHGAGRD